MNTKPGETLREKEEEVVSGYSTCQDSMELSRLYPSPSSTCQKFSKSPLPHQYSSEGHHTPSRNATNNPSLMENPLTSSTPDRATTPVLSHSPPSLLQLSPWDASYSTSLLSSKPGPISSALSPTFANPANPLLSPTFANNFGSSTSAGSLLLSPNYYFTAVLPAPANTPNLQRDCCKAARRWC